MKGIVEYEQKIENQINGVLQQEPRLEGFYNYMNEVAISTAYTYLCYVKRFLESSNKEPNQLEFDDFSKYMREIKKKEDGTNTTSSYRISVYAGVKKYGAYLFASKQLDHNPMDLIPRPKPIESKETKDKREIGYLNRTETKKYINHVKHGAGSRKSQNFQKEWRERDYALIMLFLNTGMRCSAMMKIDVTDFDFSINQVTVTDKESHIKTYDLSEDTILAVRQWLVKRSKLLDGKVEDALFISNRRTRMVQKSISRVVEKYAENIKGKHITPHKLRATYGTQLYNATHDIYFVQENMGHANPATSETYIRGQGNEKSKRAADIMGTFTSLM